MNKQMTLSLISDELAQTSTKKKEFLSIMKRMIPWSEWVAMVKLCYCKGERGNKLFDLQLMLRIHILQKLYNLADMAVMNEMIDSRAFSQVCEVDSSNQVPVEDTIGRFRRILEKNRMDKQFLEQIVEKLRSCNLLLQKGMIVDSTLISTPSSTKNTNEKRDPEAHQVRSEINGIWATKSILERMRTAASSIW